MTVENLQKIRKLLCFASTPFDENKNFIYLELLAICIQQNDSTKLPFGYDFCTIMVCSHQAKAKANVKITTILNLLLT